MRAIAGRNAALLAAGAIVVLLAAPVWLPSFYVHIMVLMLIFAVYAMSLDILMGYAGLPSLGHAAFFGVAAYTAGLLAARAGFPWWAATPIALAMSAGFALLFGLVALRTRGLYFMLITLAFAQVLWGGANRWGSFTGGYNGLPNIPRPFELVGTTLGFYYLALGLFLVLGAAMHLLVRSPFGLTLKGIRDSESRMRALGYNVWLHKYVALVLSAVFAGFAGVMSAYYNGFVSPQNLSVAVSAEGILMVILGGTGTLIGPVIGAVIIVALRSFLSIFVEHWLIVLGLAFVLTVFYAPDGVIGWLRLGARKRPLAPATESGPTGAPTLALSRALAPRAATASPGAAAEGSAHVALQLDGVSKSFGGMMALNGVSFEIRAGARVAILGPNGAGKTSLFHLIGGSLRPSSGRIIAFGRDVSRLRPDERANLGLGRTFQITNLFPTLSVLDSLRLSLLAYERRKFTMHRPAASLDSINEQASMLMNAIDLEAIRDTEVRHLSYGHQRQLEVLMALALRPRLLLLDEPTAGLSTAEVGSMVRLMRSLARDITVLIIEHDMDVAFEVAEHIMVLHHGEKLAEGGVAEIRANPEVRRIYLGRGTA